MPGLLPPEFHSGGWTSNPQLRTATKGCLACPAVETESHTTNQNSSVYKEGSDTFFLVSSVSHGSGVCAWMSIFFSVSARKLW